MNNPGETCHPISKTTQAGAVINRRKQFRLSSFLAIATIVSLQIERGNCQETKATRLDNGFLQLESVHLRLITDLPVSAAIKELPQAFDQAVRQWSTRFAIDVERTQKAKVTAYVMHDRARFVQLGLMPKDVVNFRYGYQFEDTLYVTDQPSDYYRRHLLLHEGTHWFMWKYLGGNGPPWYSEGWSELLGTHQWFEQKLVLGVIPTSREGFDYWGRIKVIKDALKNDTAPSLSEVFRFSDTAHRSDDPYAWSWAAMLFFQNHPNHSQTLIDIAKPPLDYSDKISKELRSKLEATWPVLEAEWRIFISELDYGFSPVHSLTILSEPSQPMRDGKATRTIRADRGWQSTGIQVVLGQEIRFAAQGQMVVKKLDRNAATTVWTSEPQGITLEYQNGQPLGRLLAAVIPIQKIDDEQPARRLTAQPIGRAATWTSTDSGLLLLKINEQSSGLADNSGAFTVTIE